MARGRNRRARRARRGETLFAEEWGGAYIPEPLPDSRPGVFLTPADIEQILGVLEELKEAQLSAANAERLGDAGALRAGIRELLSACYEATGVLAEIPGLEPQRRKRNP